MFHWYRELLGLRFASNDMCDQFFKTIKANQSKIVVDDSWICMKCYGLNSPMQRYCLRCTCAAEDDYSNDRQKSSQTSSVANVAKPETHPSQSQADINTSSNSAEDEEAIAYKPLANFNSSNGEIFRRKICFFKCS